MWSVGVSSTLTMSCPLPPLPRSHRWFVCAHLTAMCWKKVLNKYNDMFFFSREIWYKKSFIYVSFHRSPVQTPWRWIGLIFRNNVHLQPWVDWKILTTQLAGTEFSRRSQQGRERDSRCQRGRWRERGIVNWFGACELVWYLEIICIFSHESIEKSLPHNLQEPNSRGEDIVEDGEREVLCIDLVLVNWFDI